jgi:hypothetical protein
MITKVTFIMQTIVDNPLFNTLLPLGIPIFFYESLHQNTNGLKI